ncbi:hypothetical protein PsAD5_05193 [Pseudovibrio sp. Ad5]|uniref:hypothetical protein n=1 Tax=Pseudovibrio sp. Ad5 TaxID=989436 RepID=UPI0007AE7368|nr:hypothetical protein [Pseudovibrio sp. Ad5]KZK88842.1 hypothetical protein PsAD5_05193 [Pseudovibrio sp. Ad5]
MKEGLLDKIRGAGYWRINMRPLRPEQKRRSFDDYEILVKQSRVSLRGWDYPHISRNPDNGGLERFGDYVEAWCDWQHHSEFWRMYKSSQFLYYKNMWEDTAESQDRDRPKGKLLSVFNTIYQVSEILEFSKRLYEAGLYESGVKLILSLENSQARQLWFSKPERGAFFDEKRLNIERLLIERSITKVELSQYSNKVATEVIIEIFDNFGWNPDKHQIEVEQQNFYSKNW